MRSPWYKRMPLLGVLMLLLALPLVAARADVLSPFPLAQQEQSRSELKDQHILATGRIQNKAGEAFPENWLSLPSGTLNQTLYRIRSTRDTDEILAHYEQQLQRAGSDILFQCSGRECGSSNDWANSVFNVSTLYGVDREQHYLTSRTDHDGLSDYISVYITERATGRIYAYVSHYQVKTGQVTEQGDPKSLYQRLQDQGWVRLPVTADGAFEEGASDQLEQLVSQLQAGNDHYWLVAHHFGLGSHRELVARSEAAASNLLRALSAFGLPATRVELKGLGPLAPTKDSVNYGGRIELVRKR